MLRALELIGVQNWAIDVGPAWQPTAKTVLARLPSLPRGVPLIGHANAPMLPGSLMRLPRALVRSRRVIGFWPWELSDELEIRGIDMYQQRPANVSIDELLPRAGTLRL